MKYKICVAIPIKSAKLNLNTQIIETALNKSPDLIEFRFDYINDVNLITDSFLKELISITPPKIPKIFTFRKEREGGQYNINKNERLDVLRRLIEVKPDYLDIEINSEPEILQTLIDLAYENNVQLIFSYHDFEKFITYEEITEMLISFEEKLKNELSVDLNKIKQSIFKVIFTARDFDDNLNVLNICKKLFKQDKMFVCFAMGELGVLSRILCVKFGSLWTYGSLDEKTAPGQIKIEKIREVYDLIFSEKF